MFITNILLTLFFVFLNGFFVAAEFAIVKVRSSQVELRIRAGSKLASIAKILVEHLDEYLSATQLGITLSSLGLGWIGESVVSEIIIDIIAFLGFTISPELAHNISLPVAFAAITFLHIVFGELAPKSMAIQQPEKITMLIAIPLRIFYIIFKPFIWILNSMANLLIKMLGFEPVSEEQEQHSSEELRYLIEESTKSGIIETTEHRLLENVFDFSETPVKQIMVPHNKVVAIDLSMDTNDIIELFLEEGVSRIPVYKDDIDNILGIIYAKDVISMMTHSELIIMHDIIRPPFFVNEDEMIDDLLRALQKEKVHLAIVLDEFGQTTGIVTMEDILEELVGEIQDEYDEETPPLAKISETEYKVHALITIDDLNDSLPYPLPESDDYETLGGLITNKIGRIPEIGEIIKYNQYKIEILQSSLRTIEQVKLIVRIKKTKAEE